MTRALKIRFPSDDPEPTAEEAAIAAKVKSEIEALFGHARKAEGPEVSAYIYTPDKGYFVYDVLLNGYWRHNSQPPLEDEPIETDMEAAVSRSLAEIKAAYPNALSQQLVWRVEPEFRHLKAHGRQVEYGIPARPDRVNLYLRFTVTPMDVHGSGFMEDPKHGQG